MMLKTFIGPAEEAANVAYFRPETAQAMFVDFNRFWKPAASACRSVSRKSARPSETKSPRKFYFPHREFEQMEIEYFIREKDWKESFEYWLARCTPGWNRLV